MIADLSPERIAAIAGLSLAIVILLAILIRVLPRRLRSKRFVKKWQELQAKCADPDKWPEALKDADVLLDKALKKRRLKGKTMGERMVSAQRLLSDNDGAWFGHKLRMKYEQNPEMKLTKEQMKKALIGLGKALQDLGALKK